MSQQYPHLPGLEEFLPSVMDDDPIIGRYYIPAMREIYLCPDLGHVTDFLAHRASVGILRSFRYSIPIGAVAYPWFVSREKLERANPHVLTLYVLVTAILSPALAVTDRKKWRDVPYQLKLLLLVLFAVLIVQPIYTVAKKLGNFWAKLF